LIPALLTETALLIALPFSLKVTVPDDVVPATAAVNVVD
jgi:hypothetical protein